jgi:hypothetical protein
MIINLPLFLSLMILFFRISEAFSQQEADELADKMIEKIKSFI